MDFNIYNVQDDPFAEVKLRKNLIGKKIEEVMLRYPVVHVVFTDGTELGFTVDPGKSPLDLFTGAGDEY